MDDMITVDRGDGLAVAGLLTSLIARWDDLPLGLQAALIDHASAVAFDRCGRNDGRYVITAFVLKQRAALARRARRPDFAARLRHSMHRIAGPCGRVIDRAMRWPGSKRSASFRKVA